MGRLDQDRLELALEAGRLGTWVWDMASGTTTWDVRLEELHGLAPGGFGGTFDDWLASLYPEDRDECVARVERALNNPGSYILLHRTQWPDESLHWIECRGRVIVDECGAPTGTVGVAFDVTHREETRQAIVRERASDRLLVHSMQQALLPRHLPQVPGVTLAARYTAAPGADIGGDWYAVVPLPGGRIGVGIGDVAGHGVDAIADMADVRFGVRSSALFEDDPARVLDRASHAVQVFAPDTMITALYGILDPQARTWTSANAGHPPALLRAGKAATAQHCEADPPLGLGRDYRTTRIGLPPRSTLVLYTDGLIERRGEPLDQGIDRLIAALRVGPTNPQALCDDLMRASADGAEMTDDAAVVVIQLD